MSSASRCCIDPLCNMSSCHLAFARLGPKRKGFIATNGTCVHGPVLALTDCRGAVARSHALVSEDRLRHSLSPYALCGCRSAAERHASIGGEGKESNPQAGGMGAFRVRLGGYVAVPRLMPTTASRSGTTTPWTRISDEPGLAHAGASTLGIAPRRPECEPRRRAEPEVARFRCGVDVSRLA
jgi:hypothetical protein